MLTLAGLALAIGSMSDFSICVVENIARHHKELGKSTLDASIDGGNEMVASMVSSMLTNEVVILPLLFVSSIAQQLFQGLFVVTIFTHIAALFVALTFIPRMTAYEWNVPGLKKRPAWIDKMIVS